SLLTLAFCWAAKGLPNSTSATPAITADFIYLAVAMTGNGRRGLVLGYAAQTVADARGILLQRLHSLLGAGLALDQRAGELLFGLAEPLSALRKPLQQLVIDEAELEIGHSDGPWYGDLVGWSNRAWRSIEDGLETACEC